MGTALARKSELTEVYPPLYTALTTGVAGSVTTFSTWMLEGFEAFANIGDYNRGGLRDVSRATRAVAPVADHPPWQFMDGVAYSIITFAVALASLRFGEYVSTSLPKPTIKPPSFRLSDVVTIALALAFYAGALLLYFLGPVSWRGIATFPVLLAPPGAMLRFFLAKLNVKPRFLDRFPVGTFIANMLGTAILSATYVGSRANGQAAGISVLTCNALYALNEGFCGCLTTVSTFAVESRTVRKHRWRWLYVVGSVVLGQLVVLAIVGGTKWSRGLGPTCS